MATHGVFVTVSNNPLGVPNSSDGVMGMFIQGVAISGGAQVNTAYLLTALSDATALGITAAYDSANGLAVYQQINEFYAEAGSGALLWVVIVPTNTAYATYVAGTTFSSLIAQMGITNPAQSVKMVGLCYAPPTSVSVTNAFTGTGVNDLTPGGDYNQSALPAAYTVAIDGNAGIGTATVTAGGTGYVVGDTLTVTQSGATGGTVKVSAVTSGVVTAVTVATPGSAYSVASGLATTGGTGTGCTIAIATLCDTFKWKLNSGSFTTKVSTIGTQTLNNGVTVVFATSTGHTVNDQWVITYALGNANISGSNAFPTDVTASVTALQSSLQSLFNAGYQISGIVDGYNMNWTTAPINLPTQATNTAYGVSLCITSTKGNGVSQVGMALGRFARISVGRSVGAVADGPVSQTSAFLTNGVAVYAGGQLAVGQSYLVFGGTVTYNGTTYTTGKTVTAVSGYGTFTTADTGYLIANSSPVGAVLSGNAVVQAGLSNASITALGNAQYFFVRTYQGLSGFYWNDDATCESSTLALSSQAFNRVGNKLAKECITFFTNYLNTNLPVNTTTGAVSQSWLNSTANLFAFQYIDPLVASGDISGAQLTVTGPNFNNTKTLNFTLAVVGSPALGNVTGTITFTTTL